MEQSVDAEIIRTLTQVQGRVDVGQNMPVIELKPNASGAVGSLSNGMGLETEIKMTPVTAKENVGRNDLCPCGSGKKYKKCHGA